MWRCVLLSIETRPPSQLYSRQGASLPSRYIEKSGRMAKRSSENSPIGQRTESAGAR